MLQIPVNDDQFLFGVYVLVMPLTLLVIYFFETGIRSMSSTDPHAIHVWSPLTGERMRSFFGHTDEVTCLAVHAHLYVQLSSSFCQHC
jgi:WD40 repeat protein